jgi:hypothetical protein
VEIVDLVAKAFDRVLMGALHLFLVVTTAIENSLRGPLDVLGIKGALQTLVLMMIPILIIVAVVKLLGGFFRAVIVIVLVLVLVHVALPLVTGVPVRVN